MTALPTGTVTFLFTDLEGSTRLWQDHAEAMQSALARHDEIVRGAIEGHGGAVVKTTGDGAHAALVGRAELAGVLGGFSEHSAMGIVQLRHTSDQVLAELQQSQRDALDALGPSEYEAARARGAVMGIDEVAAYAVGAIDRILAEEVE